jgi:hypothetical protein
MRYIKFDPIGIFKSISNSSHYSGIKIAQEDEGDPILKKLREYEPSENQKKMWAISDKLKDLLPKYLALFELMHLLDERHRDIYFKPAQQILDIMFGDRFIRPFDSISKEEMQKHLEYVRSQLEKVKKELKQTLMEYTSITDPELYEQIKDNEPAQEEYLSEKFGFLLHIPDIIFKEIYYYKYIAELMELPEHLQDVDLLLQNLWGMPYASDILNDSAKIASAYLQKHFNIPEMKADALVTLVRNMKHIILPPNYVIAYHDGENVNLKEYYFGRIRDPITEPYYISLILASDPAVTFHRLQRDLESMGVDPKHIIGTLRGITNEELQILKKYLYYRDIINAYKNARHPDRWIRRKIEYYQSLPEYKDIERKAQAIMFRYLLQVPLPSNIRYPSHWEFEWGIPSDKLHEYEPFRRYFNLNPPPKNNQNIRK